MKIGEFCKKFNMTQTTIRFYINLGLLTPEKSGSQYVFSENDEADMHTIQYLHNLQFSNNEIKEYLKIERVFEKNDRGKDRFISKILNEKVNFLIKERKDITNSIITLNKEINDIENSNTSTNNKENTLGMPLEFVDMLACPVCQGNIDIKDTTIVNSRIQSGKITCTCGYAARINDGILICNDDFSTFYQSEVFFNEHYGNLTEYDTDSNYVMFGHLQDLSSETIIHLNKAHAWANAKLKSSKFTQTNPVFFLPDLSSFFLYKHLNNSYFNNALIIVSGYTEETITTVKNHIEKLGFNNKILYIANTIFSLPLKYKTVDILVDIIAGYNFSFYHSFSLYSKIGRYMKTGGKIVGYTKCYDKKSKSIKSIETLYPRAFKDNSSWDKVLKELKKENFHLSEIKDIGSIKDPGLYYDYHVSGDVQRCICYEGEYYPKSLEL